jgi:Tfp pilus assembly protein PilO
MVRNVIGVLLLAGAFGIFFFYTEPAYSGVQSVAAQGAQYDQALAKATQLQTLKQSLLARYNSFDPNALNRLSTMLPDQVDNIRLILDLDNLAGRYGMALQNVNISTPGSTQSDNVVGSIAGGTQPYDALTIQFTTDGTYEQFSQFLTALQSSLRLVDLLNLTISGAGAVSGSNQSDPNFTYTMTVQTYWLP